MDAGKLRDSLAHFTGSDTFTRHGLMRRVLMTEGVVFLAREAGAWWLMDAVASYLTEAHVRAEPFQVWLLRVQDHRGVLTMADGNGEAAIVTQEIACTDFPLAEITLWLIQQGDDWVLLLPSEY